MHKLMQSLRTRISTLTLKCPMSIIHHKYCKPWHIFFRAGTPPPPTPRSTEQGSYIVNKEKKTTCLSAGNMHISPWFFLRFTTGNGETSIGLWPTEDSPMPMVVRLSTKSPMAMAGRGGESDQRRHPYNKKTPKGRFWMRKCEPTGTSMNDQWAGSRRVRELGRSGGRLAGAGARRPAAAEARA
jgi:hypothetical protein